MCAPFATSHRPLSFPTSLVSAQRRAYKTITEGGTGSAMTQERANKLKELGFQWEALNPNNVPWEVRYSELCAFVVSLIVGFI